MSDTSVADIAPAFVPQSPFDDRTADTILTSSDGVEFHVHRVVLSLVSPVFKSMFRLPQPEADPQVPVIPMAESSLVLDRLLRFFYPGAEPVVNSIDELQEILEVAVQKYDIRHIVPIAKKYLQVYLDAHPVAVFAIACRHQWRELATDAAKSSLKLPLRSFDAEAPHPPQCISAENYHALLQYHATCSRAGVATIADLRWIAAPPVDVWFTCSRCNGHPSGYLLSDGRSWTPRSWFMTYMSIVKKALKVQPLARVDDPNFMCNAVNGLRECFYCGPSGFDQLQAFAAQIFAPKLMSEMDKVTLNLDF